MYPCFVSHFMACCLGVSVVSSRQEDHILKGLSLLTSISSPKVTYFGWIFLELQTNQGKHSVWHPFGLGVLWKSRLPLTLEIWSHRPLGEILV